MLTIRKLRKTFIGPGDLVWRAEAASVLQARGFDMISLIGYLKSQIARDLLAEKNCKINVRFWLKINRKVKASRLVLVIMHLIQMVMVNEMIFRYV